MKWLRKPGEVHGRAKLQNSMIRNAFSLLKPDGVLVYSTCSLEKEEGEDVVLDFVSQESHAELIHPFSFTSDKYRDGFFAAIIHKKP